MVKFLLWIISIPFTLLYDILTGPIPGQKPYRGRKKRWF